MIIWNDTLEIGVRSIDLEHKHLIDFINLVETATTDQCVRLCSRKMLGDLHTLFRNHFEREEDLMFGIDYPGVNNHMIDHSTMISRFDCTILKFEEDGNVPPVIEFITDWIITHLKTEDTSLASFIKKIKQNNAGKTSLGKKEKPAIVIPSRIKSRK